MSYARDYQAQNDLFAIDAVAEERAAFIRKTYAHLLLAVLAFVGLSAAFLNFGFAEKMMGVLGVRGGWIALMVGFMVVGWLANSWAHSEASPGLQYLGLGLYTVAEAVIFAPLLYLATRLDPNAIPTAGLITLLLFGGMTAIVFVSGANFSYLRTGLGIAGLAACGLIVASILFGFSLGILFSVAMVVLMSGYILYYTSAILHEYRTTQHVAAALALFASLATLFWYVLRIVMSSRD